MNTPGTPTPHGNTRATGAAPHLFDETSGRQEKHQLPQRKIRVLCLHGHRTNAKVMINQTKGLRAAMGDEHAEFIFLDAPFPATGPTDPVIERVHGQDAPFYEWWYGRAVEDVPEGETKWTWSLDNYDETLAFMDAKLAEIGPVDVVVAFSQGSVLLTVLSMLYLQTRDELPWKLCVCVGGVAVGGVQFRELMETPDGRPILVPFPSIHLIGRADPLYEESHQLADQYDSHTTLLPASPLKKMVVEHNEGHRFPSPHNHKELYEELAQRIYDHCQACDDGERDGAKRNHAFARL